LFQLGTSPVPLYQQKIATNRPNIQSFKRKWWQATREKAK